MRQLPKDEWGSLVSRYRELYGRPEDYTAQLRVLEKAVSKKPGDPALRFLAGYHYAYLGFRKQAIDQLDHVLSIEPRDELARELRDETSNQLKRSITLSRSGDPANASDQPFEQKENR